jgi:hypothetical protein
MSEEQAEYHHGNLKGRALRVRIYGTVAASTDAAIRAWKSLGISYTEVIDQLVEHAHKTRFQPKQIEVNDRERDAEDTGDIRPGRTDL